MKTIIGSCVMLLLVGGLACWFWSCYGRNFDALGTDVRSKVVRFIGGDRRGWAEAARWPTEVSSAPSVVRARSRIYGFVRGRRGQLIELTRRRAGRSWAHSVDLDAITVSAPSALALGGADEFMVFYQGEDGFLNFIEHRTGAPGWDEPVSLAGLAPGIEPMGPEADPSAVLLDVDAKDIMVFYRGMNGELWTATRLQGSWSASARPEVVLKGAPAALSLGLGQMRLFYRGLNDRLWVTSLGSGAEGWSKPEDMGLNLLRSSPAVSWNRPRQEMAVYYGGWNGNLWVTRWPDRPGGVWWSAPQDLGYPTASAPSTASAGLELDYLGGDNLIHVLHATGRWFRFWTALAASLPGW